MQEWKAVFPVEDAEGSSIPRYYLVWNDHSYIALHEPYLHPCLSDLRCWRWGQTLSAKTENVWTMSESLDRRNELLIRAVERSHHSLSLADTHRERPRVVDGMKVIEMKAPATNIGSWGSWVESWNRHLEGWQGTCQTCMDTVDSDKGWWLCFKLSIGRISMMVKGVFGMTFLGMDFKYSTSTSAGQTVNNGMLAVSSSFRTMSSPYFKVCQNHKKAKAGIDTSSVDASWTQAMPLGKRANILLVHSEGTPHTNVQRFG